jgi:hypothetical protein
MSRKVFTAGEVLAAADVNSFLMDQTVMSFAGTAARGSAIPSPVEGMVTYLEDIDDLRTYNGSSWVSPYGLTHINTTPFTAQSSFSVNNVFSPAYRNYKIILNITSKTGNGVYFIRLRAGGTDAVTNYFYANGFSRTSSVLASDGASNASVVYIGYSNADPCVTNLDVYNPNVAGNTNFTHNAWGSDGSTWYSIFGGGNQISSTQFDGFTIITQVGTGTITGTLSVYGYRS